MNLTFWLAAYPLQGHEMLFDAHARAFAALGEALLFHLLSKLYERTSVVITANLGFAEWAVQAVQCQGQR